MVVTKSKGDQMKRLFLSVSLVTAFLVFLSIGSAESMTVNGYQIDVQVTSQGMGQIQALGRVDGGAPCKKLQVNIQAKNENNYTAYISAIVDDAGNGGRVINATSSYASGSIWNVVNVTTSCLQKD
jgi:hypothetical protein